MARSGKQHSKSARTESRARYHALLPVLVVAAGVVAYHNSFSGVFVLDDQRSIVKNSHIRYLGEPAIVIRGSRRPVVDLSLALNYTINDLDVRGYHAFNLLVNVLAALALYGLVRRTLLLEPFRRRYARASPWLALAISLIWVVHPLGTQAVTYIIQRSESMMGLFHLLALYCVIRGAGSARAGRWYGAAIVCCGLGMGSKAVMVTAPVTVLIFDRVFLSGSLRRALRRRWRLYLGLAATWAILAGVGIIQGVLFSAAQTRTTVGFGYKGITPLEYALTQPGVIVQYLRLSLWPNPLCLDYAWPVARGAGQVILPAIVVLLLLGATVFALRWKPGLGFLGVWFFVILAPTSSFIPIRDPLFEHRMYLPLAAVVTLVVIGGHAALASGARQLGWGDRLRRWVAGGLVVATAAASTYATVRRNRDYRSELAMWTDVVAKWPDNSRARCNLGFALAEAGRLEEAVSQYEQALRTDPRSFMTNYNLGNAFSLLGRLEKAATHYAEAIRLKPNYLEAHINWANALVQDNRMDQAIEKLRAALEIRSIRARPPLLLKAHMNLGNALADQGEFDQAIKEYHQALRVKPDHFRAHYNLGLTLHRMGRLDQAVREYRETLRLKPDHAGARRGLEVIEATNHHGPAHRGPGTDRRKQMPQQG